MPISLPNFLQGQLTDNGLGDIVRNALDSYKGGAQARMEPHKLREEQMQRQLQNQLSGIDVKYKPREYEANIGLTEEQRKMAAVLRSLEERFGEQKVRAALDHTRAQTGHLGAQTNNLNTLTPYQAEALRLGNVGTGYANQEAALNASLSKMLFSELMGDQGGSQMVGSPSQDMPSQSNAPFPAMVGGTPRSQPTNNAPGSSRINELWRNPLYRGKLEKLGVKGKIENKIIPETGEVVQVTTFPDGTAETKVLPGGMGPQDKAFQAAVGKAKGDTYAELGSQARASAKRLSSLYGLQNLMEQNPALAETSVGPANRPLNYYLGDQEAQKFLGQFDSLSGHILLNAAQDTKGPFTGKHQAFVQAMKPNSSDPYHVLRGKLNALMQYEEMMQEVYDRSQEYMLGGMSEHRAFERANRESNFGSLQKKAYADVGAFKNTAPVLVEIVNDETGERKKVTPQEAARLMGGK